MLKTLITALIFCVSATIAAFASEHDHAQKMHEDFRNHFKVSHTKVQHQPLYDLRVLERLDMIVEHGLVIKRNATILLLVEENPSTGYEWVIDHTATNGLFSISDEFVRADDSENLGVPGRKEFTLKFGDSIGDGKFRIAQSRPWENWTVDQIEKYGDEWNYISISIKVV